MVNENKAKVNKGARLISIGFWLVIFAFMLAGIATLLTRQVLVKRLRMDNSLVRFLYSENRILLNEADLISGNKVNDPIDWEAMYPFDTETSSHNPQTVSSEDNINSGSITLLRDYEEKITSIKSDISNYADKYHPWQLYMKWLSGGYDRMTMGQEAALAREGIYVAHKEWLYRYSITGGSTEYPDSDIEELADTVADFNEYLNSKNIGFLYASATTKPCPYDRDLITPQGSGVALNRERFLNELAARNVPNYDLSKMMPHEPMDWYDLYYKTDNHWNDQGGLWCSGVLADYLNKKCGFSFDPDMFDMVLYEEDTRPDYFRGPTARGVSPFLWGKESLTRFVPRFETDYTITHYSEEGVEERKGCHTDVFFNNDVYDLLGTLPEKKIYTGVMGDHRFIENDDLYTIVNHKAPDNREKRILMLRDSFTTYVAPYLSTDVGELDLIYMPKFTGSIRTYINQTQPDAVIMLHYEDNIAPRSAQSSAKGFHFELR